jgi:hypothetical protein
MGCKVSRDNSSFCMLYNFTAKCFVTNSVSHHYADKVPKNKYYIDHIT